jgi:uncharacterized oxidoreductase
VNVLSSPLVAPHRGTDARLATIRSASACRTPPHPIVLDYATSTVAQGKVRVAHEAGKKMDEGLLLDAKGRPRAIRRSCSPRRWARCCRSRSTRGYALAVMCEILGGALSGGKVQDQLFDPSPMINNMLSVVFVPDKLTSREKLARRSPASPYGCAGRRARRTTSRS